MSTKTPTSVIEFPAGSLERIAYNIASEISAEEANDNIRLGYCLCGWLSEHRGTLEQMINAAGIRSKLTSKEIRGIILKHLEEKGIKAA